MVMSGCPSVIIITPATLAYLITHPDREEYYSSLSGKKNLLFFYLFGFKSCFMFMFFGELIIDELFMIYP